MNIYNDDNLNKRYSNLQLIELKNQVILSHENYLRIDDNEQRDEYRKQKLTKLVFDYLFKIPHQNKFILKDSFIIFERCIDKNDDFHPLKAAESFDYLFTIINNLILKPWRKEFHRLNIYNAYFKYLISKQIPNYDYILKLIGFEAKNKNGILNYYLTKRISIDILKLISFDCFICYIEFRLYYQFGQLLINKNIKPNWLFLLKLRKKLTADLETTFDNYLLIYQDHLEYELKKTTDDAQEQINKKYKHLSNLISKYEENLNQTNNRLNNNLIDLDSLPNVNKTNDLEQLLNSSIENDKTIFNHNSINNNLLANNSNISSFSNNSYRLNQQNYQQQEPIKLKNTYINNEIMNANNYLQCSDGYQRNGVEETDLDNLDQVDYIDSELNNSINNLKNELNSNIKYLNNNSQKLENILKSDDKLINGKIKSNSLEKKTNKNSKSIDKKYSTLDCRSGDKNKLKKKDDKNWQCQFCTYSNNNQDHVCKMCSKSNIKLNNKNDQLQIMGRECSLCTLVSKRDDKNCRVCGSSLINSPTYI